MAVPIIPRILHHTARSRTLPGHLERHRQELLARHPDWEYRFRDDAGARALIARELPALLPLFDAYPVPVQRADLIRVVAVYLEGGFYLDTDVSCHRSFEPLRTSPLVVTQEVVLTAEEARALGHRDRVRIGNYFFAAAPRHPFLWTYLHAMVRESTFPVLSEVDVLEHCGPGLLTRVFHEHASPAMILPVLEAPCARCGRKRAHVGPFGCHHQAGSWRWEKRDPAGSAARGAPILSAETAAAVSAALLAAPGHPAILPRRLRGRKRDIGH